MLCWVCKWHIITTSLLWELTMKTAGNIKVWWKWGETSMHSHIQWMFKGAQLCCFSEISTASITDCLWSGISTPCSSQRKWIYSQNDHGCAIYSSEKLKQSKNLSPIKWLNNSWYTDITDYIILMKRTNHGYSELWINLNINYSTYMRLKNRQDWLM